MLSLAQPTHLTIFLFAGAVREPFVGYTCINLEPRLPICYYAIIIDGIQWTAYRHVCNNKSPWRNYPTGARECMGGYLPTTKATTSVLKE